MTQKRAWDGPGLGWHFAVASLRERPSRSFMLPPRLTRALKERPEYKRRWSSLTWEQMEQDALRTWLLDRRLWPSDDPRLVSANQLADLLRRDADFLAVAAVYRGRPDLAGLIELLPWLRQWHNDYDPDRGADGGLFRGICE